MTVERDEQQALLEEMLDAEYWATHPSENEDHRCAGCGVTFDGEVECERSPRRDGLCAACWEAADRWRRRPDSERLPRIVELGHWYEAHFVYDPERALWVYSAKASEAVRLPFFVPDRFTDAELAKKLTVWVTFS